MDGCLRGGHSYYHLVREDPRCGDGWRGSKARTDDDHPLPRRVGAQVAHFRTHRGDHEVALIVERDDGGVVAMEVKLGATPTSDAIRHLTWLSEQLGDELLDSVIITTGAQAYRRADGIAVVPAALLGP